MKADQLTFILSMVIIKDTPLLTILASILSMVSMIKRSLADTIEEISFADHKIAMLSGPRQCGKTTLAKMFLEKRAGAYFNWDETRFRRQWANDPSGVVPRAAGRRPPLLVLDEIHKDRLWKRKIKGVYDTLESPCDILVTGSARLNVYRRGSDSLMGRFNHFRLHPFSVREVTARKEVGPDELVAALFSRSLSRQKTAETVLDTFMRYGPFPEPFLSGNQRKVNIWRRNREHLVVREDLRDLSRLRDLAHVELLTAMIPERVGSLFSVKAVREELEVSFDTVKRWMTYLKELYYLFEIKPWGKSIPRTLKRDGKVYLWDYGAIQNEAAGFENLVAAHLLKACHAWTDRGEGEFELFYLRDKEKRELDFLIVRDGTPWLPVEVKLSSTELSPNWKSFASHLPCRRGIQIVRAPKWEMNSIGESQILIAGAAEVLSYFV